MRDRQVDREVRGTAEYLYRAASVAADWSLRGKWAKRARYKFVPKKKVLTMNIEDGWRFYSADFSVQANGKDDLPGYVMLVRAPAEKKMWNKLADEADKDDDLPPLMAVGHGVTLEEAIIDANLAASHAKPIVVD